jgi:DNA repair protein RecO (recombination protein O)
MTATRTEAIILRRTNYGEADRILQLLTPLGRRSAIARGVRREKSKLAGGVELFACSDIVISDGKGELGILTSARLNRFYGRILQDYDQLQFGYEVIRQVARASETVDEPEWFDVLKEVLEALDSNVLLHLTQTWFYLRYAELLGAGLSLSHDSTGEKLDSSQTYTYDEAEKGFRVHNRGDINADHIKYLRIIASKPLIAVAQIGGAEHILPECRHVARQHAALE